MTWHLPVDEESGQAGEPVAAVAPFHKKKQQYQQSVSSPAHGRETSATGADQRCRPWPTRAHGYRGRLLHFPLLFFWQAVRPSSHGCRWIAYSLLGRAPVISHFSWPPFRVAVSAGQGPVSYHRRGFLRHFKLLVDPAANPLVDTVSTQLLPSGKQSGPRLTGADGLHIP